MYIYYKSKEEEIKLLNYVNRCSNDKILCKNKMEEMKKYFEIYYEGKKEIKIKYIRPLFNMSYMFCDCSSLTSLNL